MNLGHSTSPDRRLWRIINLSRAAFAAEGLLCGKSNKLHASAAIRVAESSIAKIDTIWFVLAKLTIVLTDLS